MLCIANMQVSDSSRAMRSFRERLPAFKVKSEFLKAVAENQVWYSLYQDENIYWPWFKYLTQIRSSFGVNSSNVFISMFVCVERETGGADNFVLWCSPCGILCINSMRGVFYDICSRFAMWPEIACLLHFLSFCNVSAWNLTSQEFHFVDS